MLRADKYVFAEKEELHVHYASFILRTRPEHFDECNIDKHRCLHYWYHKQNKSTGIGALQIIR